MSVDTLAGSTTAPGSDGAGLNSVAKYGRLEMDPAAPLGRTTWPPSSETSMTRAAPSTSARIVTPSSAQSSTRRLAVQRELPSRHVNRTTSSSSSTTGPSREWVSSGPSMASTAATRQRSAHDRPAASSRAANHAPGATRRRYDSASTTRPLFSDETFPPGRPTGTPASGGLTPLGEPLAVVRLVHSLVDLGLGQQQRQPAGSDRLLGDDAFSDIGAVRDVVHHLEQRLLDDGTQRPRAGLAVECDLRRGLQRPGGERELDLVEREELLELPRDGVLRLGEDPDEVLGGQRG